MNLSSRFGVSITHLCRTELDARSSLLLNINGMLSLTSFLDTFYIGFLFNGTWMIWQLLMVVGHRSVGVAANNSHCQ